MPWLSLLWRPRHWSAPGQGGTLSAVLRTLGACLHHRRRHVHDFRRAVDSVLIENRPSPLGFWTIVTAGEIAVGASNGNSYLFPLPGFGYLCKSFAVSAGSVAVHRLTAGANRIGRGAGGHVFDGRVNRNYRS